MKMFLLDDIYILDLTCQCLVFLCIVDIHKIKEEVKKFTLVLSVQNERGTFDFWGLPVLNEYLFFYLKKWFLKFQGLYKVKDGVIFWGSIEALHTGFVAYPFMKIMKIFMI